jgi:hypothetical protein
MGGATSSCAAARPLRILHRSYGGDGGVPPVRPRGGAQRPAAGRAAGGGLAAVGRPRCRRSAALAVSGRLRPVGGCSWAVVPSSPPTRRPVRSHPTEERPPVEDRLGGSGRRVGRVGPRTAPTARPGPVAGPGRRGPAGRCARLVLGGRGAREVLPSPRLRPRPSSRPVRRLPPVWRGCTRPGTRSRTSSGVRQARSAPAGSGSVGIAEEECP